MKSIDIDDDLYAFIASQTKHIGESASDILRRLLMDKTAKVPAKASAASASAGTPRIQAAGRASSAADKSQPAAPALPNSNGSGNEKARPNGEITLRLNDDVLGHYSKRVDLFLFILAQLHELHPQAFAAVEQIKGKNRIYFATSKEALLKTGSSTNPKQIPDSPYWVVTNNNTAKKVAMLEQVLQVLGYDEATAATVVARFA